MANHPFLHPKPISARITAADVADCRQAADVCADISHTHDRMADLWERMGDHVKARLEREAAGNMLSMASRWEWEANDMESTIGS